MKTLIREENSQSQNVRCSLWGEKSTGLCRRWRGYVGKAAQGREATEARARHSTRASAYTRCQPAVTETVPCVGSGFWGKRNRRKNAECLAAAVRQEKREE